MGGGVSKARILEAAVTAADSAAAGIAAGELEEALDICKKARANISKLGPKAADADAHLAALETEAQGLIDALLARWDEAEERRQMADEAASKGESAKSKALYEEAHKMFNAAVAEVGAERKADWLTPGVQDKIKLGRAQGCLKALGNIFKWEEGEDEDDSGVGLLGAAIDQGQKLVVELKVANLNTRNEDVSLFVGVVQAKDLDLGGFWYDDKYGENSSTKAWYYSMDGEVCLGEDALGDYNSNAWTFGLGDTITMELDMTSAPANEDDSQAKNADTDDDEDEPPAGILTFIRNGAKLPLVVKLVAPGEVFPAVMFAEASPGDAVEVTEMLTDKMEDEPEDRSPPSQGIVASFVGTGRLCEGMALCEGFADLESAGVSLSACRRALRMARGVLQKAGRRAAVQKCTRKLINITTMLKIKVLECANRQIAKAEADLENMRYKEAIKGFKEAQRMFQKVEEGALSRAAMKQSSVCVGRMEVALRHADVLFKRVKTIVTSTEIVNLKNGYSDLEAMVTEAETAFYHCGEPAKALQTSQLKPVCEKLVEASDNANDGDRLVQTGKASGAKFHFEEAIHFYELAKALFLELDLGAFADEMDSRIQRATEEASECVDPDAEDVEILDGMEGAAADYANAMDGKEDVQEEGAGNADPCLTGDVTKVHHLASNTFSVYVGGSFNDTLYEREALVQHVWSTVRQAVNEFGMEFEFVDPQSMLANRSDIDFDYAFHDECQAEFERCRQESVGIDFLCLIAGDDNGVAFPKYIPFDVFNEILKYVAEDKKKSPERDAIMDWFRLNTNTNPKKYVLGDKYKKMPALESPDYRKKEKAWQEWVKELTKMQKGFNFACSQQRFIRRRQEVQVGIFKSLAHLDSYERKAKIGELFKEIDQDGSGEIDKDELQKCFEILGVTMPLKEVEEFMNKYDSDGGGTIGFEELQLMCEELLLEARISLGKHGKNMNMMDVSHAHLFTETILHREVLEGILSRRDGLHLTRSLAVMWGYDPNRGPLPEDDEDNEETMAGLRRDFQAKNQTAIEPKEREVPRPDFYQCDDVVAIRNKVFRKLNPVAELSADELEIGDDEEGISDDEIVVEEDDTNQSLMSADADEIDQKKVIVKLIKQRRGVVFKAMDRRMLKKMAKVGRVCKYDGTLARPFQIIRQHVAGNVNNNEEECKEMIKEAQAKLDKIEARLFSLRNAVDRRHAEEAIGELQQDIRCMQSEAFHSMFMIVKGSIGVYQQNGEQKTKLCVLSEGDTFGDITCAAGLPRDCSLQAESDCTLVEWSKRDLNGVLEAAHHVLKTLESFVRWAGDAALRTDATSFAPSVNSTSVRNITLEALKTFRSPLALNLEDEEMDTLSSSVRLLTCKELSAEAAVGAPVATLYRQGDSNETGWGPLGRSAFVLLDGEISVQASLEGQDELPREILRLSETGDSAGEMSLVEPSIPRSHTAILCPGAIVAVISPEAWMRAVPRSVGEEAAELSAEVARVAEEAGGQRAMVEARVRSMGVLHSLRQRKSTLFKMMVDSEIDFVASVAHVRESPMGVKIVTQGEEGKSVIFVVKGTLKVLVAFAEGDEPKEVARLRLGDAVGEMLLVHPTASSSTVQVASISCVYAEVPLDELHKLLEKRPEILDTLEEMVHGGEGQEEMIRARTPLGGRAATPGGAIAKGVSESLSVVMFPFHTRKGGGHVMGHGGDSYLGSFARKVTNAVMSRVDQTLQTEIAARQKPGHELAEEVSWHLSHAKKLTRAFVGREEELDRLDTVISGAFNTSVGLINQPVIIEGEPGVGKSTLMAMAGLRAKVKRPGTVWVIRFGGLSDHSRTGRKAVRSICSQLNTIYGNQDADIPSDPVELRQAIFDAMSMANQDENLTVMIDGVDDFETPRGFNPSFDWLPRTLPKHSSLIISLKTTSESVRVAINAIFTGEVFYKISAIKSAKSSAALDKWLQVTGRTGTALSHFEAIRDACSDSAGLEGTPLNLSGLFVEICVDMSNGWMSFERPPLLPNRIQDLLLEMIVKLEEKHGRLLVERMLSFIHCSRDGASLQECFDLLSCDDDVLDEIFVSRAPKVHRVPDFTCRRLARDMQHILGKRRMRVGAQLAFLKYSLVQDIVVSRYGLEDVMLVIKYHTFLAHYWMGDWVDGKSVWHSLEPDKSAESEKQIHWRGINEQPTFLMGRHPLLLSRTERIPNVRKLRELPYHICWSSGRTTAVDPISRALAYKPGVKEADFRTPHDKRAQIWYEKHMCTMEVVRAACQCGLGFELYEDFILGRKFFIFSDVVTQFQKWLRASVPILDQNSMLTLQEGLNATGNAQLLINKAARQIVEDALLDEKVETPAAWLIHTNKDEMLDPLVLQFTGHFKGVFSVNTSANDDLVLTSGADGSVRLYDISSGQEIKKIDAHPAAVRRCCFSPNSREILTASSEGSAIVWDIVSSEVVCVLMGGHDGEVMDAIWLNDDTVVTCSNDMDLIRWGIKRQSKDGVIESTDGEQQMTYKGHMGAVTCIIDMCKATQIVSAGYDKTIRVWDVAYGDQLLVLLGHIGVVYGLALSPDGSNLLSCSSDCTVKVWDVNKGEEIETLRMHSQAILCVCYDPSGKWIVTGSVDNTVRLCKIGTDNPSVVVGRHDAAVLAVNFSSNGQYILSAGRDDVTSMWDWSVAYQTATDDTPDHVEAIIHVEFSARGTHFMSLSSDGIVILRVLDWEGNCLATSKLTDENEPAVACKFSPDGLVCATLHPFGCLFWGVQTGSLVGRLAQVYDLDSLIFPSEQSYEVAAPLSPHLEPPIRQFIPEDEKGAMQALKLGSDVSLMNDVLIIESPPPSSAGSRPHTGVTWEGSSRPGTVELSQQAFGEDAQSQQEAAQDFLRPGTQSRPGTNATLSRPGTEEGLSLSRPGTTRLGTSGSVRFSDTVERQGVKQSGLIKQGMLGADQGEDFAGSEQEERPITAEDNVRLGTSGSVSFSDIVDVHANEPNKLMGDIKASGENDETKTFLRPKTAGEFGLIRQPGTAKRRPSTADVGRLEVLDEEEVLVQAPGRVQVAVESTSKPSERKIKYFEDPKQAERSGNVDHVRNEMKILEEDKEKLADIEGLGKASFEGENPFQDEVSTRQEADVPSQRARLDYWHKGGEFEEDTVKEEGSEMKADVFDVDDGDQDDSPSADGDARLSPLGGDKGSLVEKTRLLADSEDGRISPAPFDSASADGDNSEVRARFGLDSVNAVGKNFGFTGTVEPAEDPGSLASFAAMVSELDKNDPPKDTDTSSKSPAPKRRSFFKSSLGNMNFAFGSSKTNVKSPVGSIQSPDGSTKSAVESHGSPHSAVAVEKGSGEQMEVIVSSTALMDEVEFEVDDETPLWAFIGLLSELEGKRKPPSRSRRPEQKQVENRVVKVEEQKKEDAYDIDVPDAAVDAQNVQKVLFMLDKLEATLDPNSRYYGMTSQVITDLKEENICARNICVPSRGIPSLSVLVAEAILPYLSHPDTRIMISAASALAVIADPKAKHIIDALQKLVSHEQITVRHASLQAKSHLEAKAESQDDLADVAIKKTLTIQIVEAKNLTAADANGTSDPFVSIVLMDFANLAGGTVQAGGLEIMRTGMDEIELEDPEFVELALKRMMMRSCLLFEMLTTAELREILMLGTAVNLGTDQVLMYEGEPCESMFLVVNGVLRVMVDIERARGAAAKKPRDAGGRNGTSRSARDGYYGQQVAVLDHGDTIGEMNFFLKDAAGATVIASTECRLVEFTQNALEWVQESRPDVVEMLLKRALEERKWFIDESKKSSEKAKKTKVVQHTLDPVWDESFNFSGVSVDSVCVMTVFDHDLVGSHDFLGTASIDVRHLELGVEHDEWLDLEKRTDEDEVSGQIRVKVTLSADKRPRIVLPNGNTLVASFAKKSLSLYLEKEIGEKPTLATTWNTTHEISSYTISPNDPRVIALGDIVGGVFILRVQDMLNHRYEREMRNGGSTPGGGSKPGSSRNLMGSSKNLLTLSAGTRRE